MNINILEKIPYERIGDFPNYQRWLAVGMVHVLLFTGYFFFSYKGKVDRANALTDNLNNIEGELKKNSLRRKRLPELRKKIDKLNFKLLIARTQLPGSKEVPELLEHISNLGRSSGLEFLLFKPQAEIPKDFYTEVPVQMKVSGTFHDITNFFDKVGNFARIVNVSNIKMGGAKGEGKKTFIQTSCNATTFMYTGNKDTAKDKKKTYLNNKFGFSLQYNRKWRIKEVSGVSSTAIFTSPDAEKGYKANMSIKVEDKSGKEEDRNKNFYTLLIEQDKQDARVFKNDYTIISEKDITLSDFTAYQITSSYTKDKTRLKEKVVYISKDKKKIFKITGTALDENFKKYEPVFDEGVSSFWIHSKDDFKKIGEEKFWAIPVSTYNPAGKRDPFNSLLIAKEAVKRVEVEEDDEKGRIKGPLEMVDTLSLKLVGIIWDRDRTKKTALIETSDGKGYVVKRDARLGRKRGRIMNITKDSVIVEERRKYRIGDKIEVTKKTVVLKLKKEREQ